MTIIIYHYAMVRVEYRDTPPLVFIFCILNHQCIGACSYHLISQGGGGRRSLNYISSPQVVSQLCCCASRSLSSKADDSFPGDLSAVNLDSWGANYCLSCLCSPCITVKPPDFLRGSLTHTLCQCRDEAHALYISSGVPQHSFEG